MISGERRRKRRRRERLESGGDGSDGKRGKPLGFLALCALGRRQALKLDYLQREKESLLVCFKLKHNTQKISCQGGMKI